MHIVLASRDNGVGLTTDMRLLADLFAGEGHRVTKADWRVPRIPQCDVLIFLELFSPRLMQFAKKSIGIFNPEWFIGGWRPAVQHLDQIWAKSLESLRIFSAINPRTFYTGFLTRDVYDGSVIRQMKCIHVQGHSQDKNTERVLETWRTQPDLPPLTVVGQVRVPSIPNVQWVGRIPEKHLTVLMNQHIIHLCPSRVEGWGHYISEALSVQGFVITPDLSPMNEHVQPEWGHLLKPTIVDPRGMTKACDISPVDLAHAVRSAVSMNDEERGLMQEKARSHALHRNAAFREIALKLLES